MKTEVFMKLALSFKAFGLTLRQVTDTIQRLSNSLDYTSYLLRKMKHRKRCALIAFALSQTCSRQKKHILWNLFKHQTI